MQKFLFIATLALSFSAHAQVFKNISILQNSLGFQKYYNSQNAKPVKVAIFDKGFEGYKAEIGKSLPANTKYIPGPVAAPDEAKTEHGLRMAQIFTALATNNLQKPGVISEFYLYNVFGYSNFKAAVDDAIARGIDVISYSEVWEYGGNNDGQGFINAEVTRATNAGIIWVNAAGNFALTTYNSAIVTGNEDWVKLPDQNNALALRCEQSAAGKCQIKAVLSWNDFKNEVSPGTDKDLDFAITDDMLNIIQTSGLRQSKDPNENRPGYSKYAREIITAELKPGTYYFRVKDRSKNFTSSDRLRITVDGDNVTMPHHVVDESILNPGDNPSAITVGAFDADRSSISLKLNKPDIMAPSSMILQSGGEFRGSSNATAVVAAGVALIRSANPGAERAKVLAKMSKAFNWDQGSLSINSLRFMPTNNSCFNSREWSEAPDYIKQVLTTGGLLVETSAQYRIMLPFDPILLAPDQQRQLSDDMVIALPQGGIQIIRRLSPVPQGAIELFQRPVEFGLCNVPLKRAGRVFLL
jgi:subtilisin family serine protease